LPAVSLDSLTVWMCSHEEVRSYFTTHRPLDMCVPTSTSVISPELTTTDADSTTHVDITSPASSVTAGAVQTQPLIVTDPLHNYHAITSPILPAMTSSLLGYVDLIPAHQPVPCVSPPPPLLASQSCLTTKIRSFPLIPTKFTPY